jgi:hypothetical protein
MITTISDEVDSLAFGVRKTTTRLPVNNDKEDTSVSAVTAGGVAKEEESDEDEDLNVDPNFDESGDYCSINGATHFLKLLLILEKLLQWKSAY